MTIEDVLETDHFIPSSQPSAPSHTIPQPKKSGISVKRIPVPLMSLITVPPQASIDFGIQNEPDVDDFEIAVLTTAQAAVVSKVAPSSRSLRSSSINLSSSKSNSL